MSQEIFVELTIEVALARYRQGKCPGCGRGIGDARGLEYRARSGDIYCHGCKSSWPLEMDATSLQDRLSFTESPQPEIVFPATEKEGYTATRTTGRLAHFFRRLVLKN